MLAEELKKRLDRLGLTRDEAAALLGLSPRGLYHQMSGERPVTRQTELLLDHLDLIVALTSDMTAEQKRAVVENGMRKFEHRKHARQMLAERGKP